MNDRESRRIQMFVRVDAFGDAHIDDFLPNSIGRTLFADLKAIIAQLNAHAAAEVSGRGSARQGTDMRDEARRELREDLQAIFRTAEAMDGEGDLISENFRLPRKGNDRELLNAARAIRAKAEPLKAQFIAHELRPDFLEDLDADLAAFEKAITDQSSAVGDHVAANAAFDAAMARGNEIVRKLDAIVRNKYANNPGVLAEWTSASHTERSPRRKATAAPPPPPAPAAPPAPGH
jgi:hypothetical protein